MRIFLNFYLFFTVLCLWSVKMKKIFLCLLCFSIGSVIVIGCTPVNLFPKRPSAPTAGDNDGSNNGAAHDDEIDDGIDLGECLIAKECGGSGRNRDDDDDDNNYEKFEYWDDRYEAYGEIDNDDFKDGALTDFRLGHRLNYPVRDGKVYVELERESNENYYKGTVLVAYEKKLGDGEKSIATHKFHSGYGRDARYNVWARFNGQNEEPSFHGFFENGSQAIIFIVGPPNNPLQYTDGREYGSFEGSGSIWHYSFKSFDDRGNHNNCYEGGRYVNIRNWPDPPNKKCWFISVGPFNCQAWNEGNNVNTFLALEPDSRSCYKKLADFEKLNVTKAFNLEDEEDGRMYITQ